MALITKKVEIKVVYSTIEHYENLGYEIIKKKDKKGILRIPSDFKILARIEDLTNNSSVKVDVECDGCGCKLEGIKWQDYKKCVKEDGKYYCKSCASKLYGANNARKAKLRNSKSFFQWCIENNRKDILDRWDYKLNTFIPDEISYGSIKKYYFKCPRNIHESELKNINSFVVGHEGSMCCKKCNSFAQWGIDNLGEDFLEKYWDYEKNTINPWEIERCCHNKIWIKCQKKEYHGSNKMYVNNFTIQNQRCPICNGLKVHKYDSLGWLYSEVFEIWSDKNEKTPYEYTTNSGKKVWWKCKNNKHKDYFRKISESMEANLNCPECIRERDESFLQEKVRLYLNQLKYIVLHERNCSIIPVNPKTRGTNNTMPFDNEVVELKLIIEVHGVQHYEITGFHKLHSERNNTTPEYELHKQQLYDRYKRIHAKSKGYEYLEIPYTSEKNNEYKKLIYDKIEQILNNQILNIDKIKTAI